MAINDFIGDITIDSKTREVPVADTIVDAIVDQFISRSLVGKKKYGTNLDRQDLSLSEWLEHSIQEHMDSILYLKKIKQLIDGKK